MTHYDEIYEALCEKVDSGEISIDKAEVINDAAAEKYLSTEYIKTTDEFKEAYQIAIESMMDETTFESPEEYLDMMELEMFGESTEGPRFEQYMTQDEYELLIKAAILYDRMDPPAKYVNDPVFVKQFRKDVKKADKAMHSNLRKGTKKAIAATAAAAAIVGTGIGMGISKHKKKKK